MANLITRALKAIPLPRWNLEDIPRLQHRYSQVPGRGWITFSPDDPNYTEALERAEENAVIVAIVDWIARKILSMPWVLEEKTDDGWEPVDDSPIVDLLQMPTPYHDSTAAMLPGIRDLLIHGTTYWLIAESRGGGPSELWWRPSSMVGPLRDRMGMLAGYRYRVDELNYDYEPQQVVSVQLGQMPDNPFLGVSPLTSLAPEVWLAFEAMRREGILIDLVGDLGLIISPSSEDMAREDMSEDDIRQTRDYIQERTAGRQRGRAMYFDEPMNVNRSIVNPADWHPKAVLDFVEEHISAAYHLPASVAGFGPGMEQTQVGATMVEQLRQAWDDAILPNAAILESQMGRQLLPLFGLDPMRFRLAHDTSTINVLRDDDEVKARTWQILINTGIATPEQGAAAFGIEYVEPEPEPEPEPPPPPMMVMPAEDDDDDEMESNAEVKRFVAKVLDHPSSVKRSRSQNQLVAAFMRDQQSLEDRYIDELEAAFDDLGARVAAAFEHEVENE